MVLCFLYVKLVNLVKILRINLLLIISKSFNISGHKSKTQIIVLLFFIFEKNIDVKATVIGLVPKVNT